MNRKIKKGMKKREKLWKQYDRTPSHRTKTAYTKKRNEVSKAIKDAKVKFECKLADNIKEDPKSFYAYVRSKSRARVGIGSLKDEHGAIVEEVTDMTRILNNYFTSVFTSEN